MKNVGTIGYAPNIGNKKRNVTEYNLKRNNDRENLDQDSMSNLKDSGSSYKSSVPI